MSIKLTPPFILNDDGTFNITFEESLKILRIKRNYELKITDVYFLSDTTILISSTEKSELNIKRQTLRDITEGITTVEQVLKALQKI